MPVKDIFPSDEDQKTGSWEDVSSIRIPQSFSLWSCNRRAGAELYDEGEDSHGWGLSLIPATLDDIERRRYSEREDIRKIEFQSNAVVERASKQSIGSTAEGFWKLHQGYELPIKRSETDRYPTSKAAEETRANMKLSPLMNQPGIMSTTTTAVKAPVDGSENPPVRNSPIIVTTRQVEMQQLDQHLIKIRRKQSRNLNEMSAD
ncbi:hypothetical protein DSL72_004424 [Monilinia vaccinii-corymbosi]|uniref:Uncharacterized protein n=1 Tax=Monilinia vaccinii-corymbosi TaxID=61207 RepID=A0A8A3P3S7_9HELO|nr:hypothetical protein DSL72_004424 [Monilinia vaccinii-corymbosi]